jgi:hypothetical protein
MNPIKSLQDHNVVIPCRTHGPVTGVRIDGDYCCPTCIEEQKKLPKPGALTAAQREEVRQIVREMTDTKASRDD